MTMVGVAKDSGRLSPRQQAIPEPLTKNLGENPTPAKIPGVTGVECKVGVVLGVVGQKREPETSSHFPNPTQLRLLRNRDIPQSQISELEPEVAARQEDDDGDGPSHRRSMNQGGRATRSRNGDARNCDHDYRVQKEEEDGEQV